MSDPSLTIGQAGEIGQAIRQLASQLNRYFGAVDALLNDALTSDIAAGRFAQSVRIHRAQRDQVTATLTALQTAWNGAQEARSGPQTAQEKENQP